MNLILKFELMIYWFKQIDFIFQMNTSEYLGLIDDGPDTVIFDKICNDLKNKKLKLKEILEPYSKEFKYKSLELNEVLKTYSKIVQIKKNAHKRCITMSVVKWIFYTNKIEFTGLETEEDTKNVLENNDKSKTTIKEKEVLQVFDVLKEYYNNEEKVYDHIFDIILLQKWHKKMFNDIIKNAGEFRTCGVKTNNPDCSKHRYPHHSIIKNSINNLCHLLCKLSKFIDEEKNKCSEEEHICNIIGLASFIQFHFVDIHPFLDGNGRMCIFLSKFILDTIFPIPIPMFQDRDEYINSLVNGRKSKDHNSSILLANLIFDTSISFYKSVIKNDLSQPLHYLISVSNVEELTVEIKKLKIEDQEKELLIVFKELSEGDSKVIENISFGIYDGIKIKKNVEIDWDEL